MPLFLARGIDGYEDSAKADEEEPCVDKPGIPLDKHQSGDKRSDTGEQSNDSADKANLFR